MKESTLALAVYATIASGIFVLVFAPPPQKPPPREPVIIQSAFCEVSA